MGRNQHNGADVWLAVSMKTRGGYMETKLKATPGPWLHRAKSDSVHMPPPEQPYIYGEIIFAFSEYLTPSDENLALILAAPDLYAALEAMLEVHGVTQEYADKHIEIPQSWVEASEIARAALKRARGEA